MATTNLKHKPLGYTLKTLTLFFTLALSNTAYAVSSGDSSAEQKSYIGLDGPMIVNILSEDTIHFLQVTTEFKLKDPSMAEAVKTHMAPIRHNLMMLFSDKKFSMEVQEYAKL